VPERSSQTALDVETRAGTFEDWNVAVVDVGRVTVEGCRGLW
jgi:hypothetical protein